jgi:gentisate 1,2-dioxygenase
VSPIEFAERQQFLLTNPGLGGRLQVTSTMRCAVSIYNPGDVAPVHIHTPNASRTILSEKGGYTTIEGERCEAARGDLILTPNGTWHDHGNDGSEPVVWIVVEPDAIEKLHQREIQHIAKAKALRRSVGGNLIGRPTTFSSYRVFRGGVTVTKATPMLSFILCPTCHCSRRSASIGRRAGSPTKRSPNSPVSSNWGIET